MGQANTVGLLAAVQGEEFCTCLRHISNSRGGSRTIPVVPPPPPDAAPPAGQQTSEAEPAQTPPGEQSQPPSPRSSLPPSEHSFPASSPPSVQTTSFRSAASRQLQQPSTHPATSSVARAGAVEAARKVPHLDTWSLISQAGRFSSYAQPTTVEYRDAEGNWTVFARRENGKVDLHINGQERLRNLTSISVDGLRLQCDGHNCSDEPQPECLSVLAAEEPTACKSPVSWGHDLRRLDRSEDVDEVLGDWFSADAIRDADVIQKRVLALFGQPDTLTVRSRTPPLSGREAASQALDRNSTEEAAGARIDMTPEGFKVLHVQHMVLQRGPNRAGQSSPAFPEGLYFFFDWMGFPGFAFINEPVEVEQWRGGSLLWTGKVRLWKATDWEGSSSLQGSTATGCTARGCRWPPNKAAAEHQWEVGDTVYVMSFHLDANAFAGGSYKDNIDSLSSYLARIGNGGDASAEAPLALVQGPEEHPHLQLVAGIPVEAGRAGSSSSRSSSFSAGQPAAPAVPAGQEQGPESNHGLPAQVQQAFLAQRRAQKS